MPVDAITAARPRDAARTKRAILDAAIAEFSTQGYVRAGVRDIAARAGANSTLIARYFGSKEQLFEAALREVLPVEMLTVVSRTTFGDHVARLLSSDHAVADVVSLAALASADPVARQIVVRLYEERVISVLSKWLDGAHAQSRAARITVLCTGFVMYRRMLPLAGLRGPDEAMSVRWLARALQDIVDEAPPATA